jgi:hypothetical protein
MPNATSPRGARPCRDIRARARCAEARAGDRNQDRRARRAARPHGALLAAQILAEIYVELLGGKEVGYDLGPVAAKSFTAVAEAARPGGPLLFKSRLTDAEREWPAAFVGTMKTPIWAEYLIESEA